MTGQYFAGFIRNTLELALHESSNNINTTKDRLFVMDNDASQTSKAAMEALSDIQATFIKIPPCSPDLNPIENVFHNVKREQWRTGPPAHGPSQNLVKGPLLQNNNFFF